MGSLPCWRNPCKTWIKDNFQKSTFGLRVGGATHHYHYLGIGAFVEVVSFEVVTPKIAARVACGEKVSSLSWQRKGRFVEFVGGEHYIVFSLSMVRHLCILSAAAGLLCWLVVVCRSGNVW